MREKALFAKEWRASKGKVSPPRIFPCDAAAVADAKTRRGGGSSSTVALPAPYGILPREYSTPPGSLVIWRARLDEWEPAAGIVEPAAITMTSNRMLLRMCVRAMVHFSFLLHQHIHPQLLKHKTMFENHVPKLAAATLMMWSQSNHISDLHVTISQEMLDTLHAEG